MRWDFTPIAAGRGLPEDVSEEARTAYEADIARFPGEFHSVTWIGWEEIQAINWDEPLEDRIIESRRGHGPFGSTYWRTQFLQSLAAQAPGVQDDVRPGHHWTVRVKAYEVIATQRRDVIEYDWAVLFRMMEALTSRYDPDYQKLRLVVWFAD